MEGLILPPDPGFSRHGRGCKAPTEPLGWDGGSEDMVFRLQNAQLPVWDMATTSSAKPSLHSFFFHSRQRKGVIKAASFCHGRRLSMVEGWRHACRARRFYLQAGLLFACSKGDLGEKHVISAAAI